MRLAFDPGRVDAEQPGRRAAEVAAQPRLGLEAADEFVAAAGGPGIRARDQLLQVRDEVGPDLLVTLGLFGVVADHEPLGSGALVAVAVPAGGDRDFLDPQVVGHGAVAPGAGQRAGGLGVGVARLLGVDVVAATPGQVGPVGRGGEPAVAHPHQPAQTPPG